MNTQIPKQPKPRPPATLTLEEEEMHFYAAIGKTMMQWQAVEASLSNVFCALVGPPGNSGLANIAFYSVESFRTKLAMTNNVVTERFSFIPDRIPEWHGLNERTRKRNNRRNVFAHYGMEVDQKAKAGYRYRLRPSPNSLLPDITSGYNPSAYRLCEIIVIGDSFETLATDLTIFFEKIRPTAPRVASP